MRFEKPDADEWLQRLGLEVVWKDLRVLEESVIPPVIMLNRATGTRQRRWLIFHAIAHSKLHTGNQLYMLRHGDRIRLAKQERQAEEWTARLLIPGTELLDRIANGMEADDLADEFGVPEHGIELAIELLGHNSALRFG